MTGALLLNSCSAENGSDQPEVKLSNPLRITPGPQDTSLQLFATGVDGCDNGDHKVVDVTVEETETEVVVSAGVQLDNQPFCESRYVHEDFAVDLERPLGQRLVIDNSRGRRKVIWSPQRRKNILRRVQVNTADAEALIRSKFSAAPENTRCFSYGAKYFSCPIRVPSREQPVSIYVFVRADGELKALAGEKLPPELRTCNPRPGRPGTHRVC
jgi:hypothetical protein